MIDSVVFDLGKVLVDFHPQKGMETLGFSKEAIDAFNEAIFSGFWEECDRIPYSEEAIRTIFKEKLPEYKKEVDLLWNQLPVITGVKDYTNDWLDKLKKQGIKLYVLSNFGKRAFEINSQIYDFLHYMDGKVVSYEIQKCKPEPEIYEELIKRYQIVAKNAVFIDDRKVNVDGAIKLGFKGIVFESYEQANAELEVLLKKNVNP